MHSAVLFDGEALRSFSVDIGVKQGAVSSPTLSRQSESVRKFDITYQ
jgi:hypothetical protein